MWYVLCDIGGVSIANDWNTPFENSRSAGRLCGTQNSCFVLTDPSNNRVYNGVYNTINLSSEIETCNLNRILSFVIDR